MRRYKLGSKSCIAEWEQLASTALPVVEGGLEIRASVQQLAGGAGAAAVVGKAFDAWARDRDNAEAIGAFEKLTERISASALKHSDLQLFRLRAERSNDRTPAWRSSIQGHGKPFGCSAGPFE